MPEPALDHPSPPGPHASVAELEGHHARCQEAMRVAQDAVEQAREAYDGGETPQTEAALLEAEREAQRAEMRLGRAGRILASARADQPDAEGYEERRAELVAQIDALGEEIAAGEAREPDLVGAEVDAIVMVADARLARQQHAEGLAELDRAVHRLQRQVAKLDGREAPLLGRGRDVTPNPFVTETALRTRIEQLSLKPNDPRRRWLFALTPDHRHR